MKRSYQVVLVNPDGHPFRDGVPRSEQDARHWAERYTRLGFSRAWVE